MKIHKFHLQRCWAVISWIICINCLGYSILYKSYATLMMDWINRRELAIADLIRPINLFQTDLWGACVFYLASLCFLFLLILQIYLIRQGSQFFSGNSFNLNGIKQLFQNHFSLSLRNIWQSFLLFVLILPFSKFLLFHNYFTALRLNEYFDFTLNQAVSSRITTIIVYALYLSVAIYWVRVVRAKEQMQLLAILGQGVFALIGYYTVTYLLAGLIQNQLRNSAVIYGTYILTTLLTMLTGLFIWQLGFPGSIKPTRSYISAFLALVMLVGYLMPLSQMPLPKINSEIFWIAHKGVDGRDGVPNSVQSLRQTAAKHPDYVEIDIRFTKDQQFVVIHDHNLNKLTRHSGFAENLTLHRLTGLTQFDNQSKTKLNSFTDYLRIANDYHQPLLVEIKTLPKENRTKLVHIFADRFGKALKEDHGMIHTTDPKIITACQKLLPDIPCGYIVPLTFWGLPKTSANFYSMEYTAYSFMAEKSARHFHKNVMIWTLNDPLQRLKYKMKSVDGIISDDFSALKSADYFYKNAALFHLEVWLYLLQVSP